MADEEPAVSIRERLLKERHALLDLSTRNRLLNTPLRTRNNRAVEIVDEKSAEVFRLLTTGKALTFLAGAQLSAEERAELDPEDDITGAIPQPEDDEVDERGVASRHADTKLQTKLTSEGLQKRLFDIWYDAQTLEQEQGVNILYLAIGLLRWFDNETSDIARHAPLILLPVRLERSSAADRFKLRGRDEPPSPNLTLQAKMRAEFALTIEDFRDEDEVDLGAYCAKVAETVSKQPRWEVLPDAMVLGFFSFSKFLMYRDLDPDIWPKEAAIDAKPMIASLLRDGFPESAPLVADDAVIDDVITPIDLNHVVDADSSQTVAIAEAAGGRSLVVKGPPGTGKSQTITNIIAAAVARGKRVLFVAEKMAALDVVHRRLRQVGLGPLTLELHSNKVNKRTVLEELKRTRDAQHRALRGDASIIDQLGDASSKLNAFARRLHQPLSPSGLSPQAILGRLASIHGAPPSDEFPLSGAEAWDGDTHRRNRQVAEDVASRAMALGSVPANPWRGIGCASMDPVERERLGKQITSLAGSLVEAIDLARRGSEALRIPEPASLGDISDAVLNMSVVPLPPAADRATLGSPLWGDAAAIARLLQAGRVHSAAWAAAEHEFNAAGLNASFEDLRSSIAIKGGSLFRFLDGAYRGHIALLKSFVRNPLPKQQADRLALVDSVVDAQAARRKFEALTTVGAAFGSGWKGEESDWNALDAVRAWRFDRAQLANAVWNGLAKLDDLASLERIRRELTHKLPEVHGALDALFSTLVIDVRRAFGVEKVNSIPLAALDERLGQWGGDLEGLSNFAAFAGRARTLAELGAAPIVDALYGGGLEAPDLVPTFDRGYAEVLRVALFTDWPELRAFDGTSYNQVVSTFRQLDRSRIELAQEQIVAAHAAGRPASAAGIGPLGVLNAEIAKKRGHLPIRLLLERAGPAIQKLKPVFMMSPLSVAQFLKPGAIHFDILVMDEASQIEPVDALGAIARADQIVIVGDEKQLPPTTFFKKLTGEEDAEELDEGIAIQAKDAESILELCLAKGVPSRMLSWHYRSKHQSLIAVSNREFYENKLFIVPSPYDAVAGMGLKFNLLKDAPYERGGTRTNPVEAKVVAEAVIRHARENPGQSLGVATFSVAQRQVILKELELLRRANPDLEEFFATGTAEPFFVKNLENIQGDERDVILISIGYGKTAEGYLAHSFGPLSGDGGERRLNVLISRAKLRCEVFSNFTGADIDLERTKGRGVVALKLFLTFAETGHFGLGDETGEEFDSEFEIQVCERLQSRGHDMKRQIGASGFRVDLAISDPGKPGRFILGIECDGAQFHSSRSARDRDRLRQQVLEAHGWIIHRVWSADWFLRPETELRRIEDAIAAAKAEWEGRDENAVMVRKVVPVSFEVRSDGEVDVVEAVLDAIPAPVRIMYDEADFPVDISSEPHDAPLGRMVDYVTRIVATEGPVHQDEIVARIRILWGLGRAGSRIRASVTRALDVARDRGLIEGGPFYSVPGQIVTVRDRSAVSSASLRRPEALPPSEIERAALDIVAANFGASSSELVQSISRSFGFASTSAQLKAVIIAVIALLVSEGRLVDRGGLITGTQ